MLVFAALIHDANYDYDYNYNYDVQDKNVVAEQNSNSIERALSLLMEPAFHELRGCIYESQSAGIGIFRRLLVKSVMTTTTSTTTTTTTDTTKGQGAVLVTATPLKNGSFSIEDQKAS